jgi:excisionase family DNA binding protein
MVKSGRLQAVRVGRRILIPISELEKLMKPGAVSQTGRKNT